MVAAVAGTFIGTFVNIFDLYIYPYLAPIVVLGILVWIAEGLNGRSKFSAAKRAVFSEIRLNIEVCKAVQAFVDTQKVGDPYTTPMPRFYTAAFEGLKNQGYLFKMKRELRDDLTLIYMTIDRISQAANRQEELLVGAAATSPLAADLRSQNLSYIHSTISNVIKPRLDRLRTLYRF